MKTVAIRRQNTPDFIMEAEVYRQYCLTYHNNDGKNMFVNGGEFYRLLKEWEYVIIMESSDLMACSVSPEEFCKMVKIDKTIEDVLK